MKKLNKLFAILIAVLGVQTLSAQTDVTSQYLTNADFSSTVGWTQHISSSYRDIGSGNIGGKLASYAASSTDATHLNSEHFFGFQCRWSSSYASYNQETSELPAGVYTLSYDVENVNGSTSAVNYNNLFYVKVGDKTFTDTSVEWMKGKSSWTSHSITFVITEAAKATVSLGYGTGSNNLGSGNTPVLYVSHLKLTHRNIDDISAENPADLTSYIVNNSFETGNLDGWTYIGSSDTGVKPNSNGTYTTSGVDGNYLFNTWWKGTPLTQTVTNIPNGVYVLNVLVASGDGADKPKPNIFLTANGEHSTAYNISDGNNKVFHDVSYEFKVLNGQATIGVIGGNDAGEYVNGGHWWYKADNFRLTYKGADLFLLQDAFNANYTNLKNLSTEDVVPTAFAQKINDLISTYETAPTSKKDLTTANTDIESVVNAHPNIVTAYGSLKNLISTCNSLTTISAEQTSGASETFATAISAATTAADAATTVTELNNAYNTLEAARRNYMQNAYPTSGNTLDFSYLIANGDWENNSGSNKVVSGVAHEEKYAEKPWKGEVMWDEVSGLANGMYTVEVYLSASAAEWNHTSVIADGDKNTSITVNDVKTLVEVYKRKSLSEAAVITLQNVMVKDGKMNFMITNDAEGANWVMVAHKSITMTGKIDNTALQNRITTLLADANGIKGSDMNSAIKTTLTTAINNADATSEDPDALNQMIESLEAAIAAANPSIADYAKLKRYIAMTKVFTDVSAYETKYDAGEYSADNVEPIRQELNVMRFNAASTICPNPYEVTGWTGDLANDVRSDQHWSGDTKDYYDANSWHVDATGLKHTLSTTVTLPEGTYVLKAAGRSDSDATLRLTIKNGDTVLESVEYTGKGDTGYGITINGCASFSADSTYANNDAGRGWEWEFAKFELDAETTVTLHVEVDYNNIQNRFGSFSDITLWMDDETYVTVYGKELDAPLAEAKTLVNTLPMGDTKNTALSNAIATGEGKLSGPAELNAAVKALEDAVAAAKAWRETYYAEKEKLVVQLERFEAEYNDAENGALDYMCKTRWATAIEKTQAAALAKDNLTSHEGLTTAANELELALDAATKSIGEYTELKAAIENADELGGGDDWGYEPFQKPESAKENINVTKEQAQAAYDAAEVDGEGVTTLIESLNIAINEIVLNAPKEGQRYYIKVATEDHGKKDNAWLVTLGGSGANNPTGYGINANNVVKGHLNQTFIFTQVEGNLYNISIEREEGTVYLTYGALNGSAAGWKNQQIQATTNAENKGEFKIVPTGKNGILKIFNTIDNNYLDCQGGGAIYTDTGIENEEFAFELASENTVTLTLSKVGWATLILPFNAELPEGVKAYSCGEADGETLTLIEAESIKANTPYLMNGYQSTHNFSGYGLADKDSYTDGLFIGTYVDYVTTANSNTYVLQKKTIDGKDDVAFYLVGESAQPTVNPYRIYMVYEGAAGAPKFSFGRGEGTTSIDNMESTANSQQPIVIYDLLGRKVNTMEKGGMYIVNGKKVIVK